MTEVKESEDISEDLETQTEDLETQTECRQGMYTLLYF